MAEVMLFCSQHLQAAAMDGNNEEALQFEWTSPLAGAPSAFSRVKGVIAEQAMVCMSLPRLSGADAHVLHKEEVNGLQVACAGYAAFG